MRSNRQGKNRREEKLLVNHNPVERESLFTSLSGKTFHVNDTSWIVGNHGGLNPEQLKTLSLSDKEAADLRYTLAVMATLRPFSSMTKFISGIKTSNISSLTSKGVRNLSNDISGSSIDSLKAVSKQLVKIDRDYRGFHDAVANIQKKVQGRSNSNIYDVEIGALSEYEIGDLTEKLNAYSAKIFSDCRPTSDLNSIHFGKWLRLVLARFMVIFSRRPSQLAQIKWCDLSLVKSELGNEIELSMPMAKQSDGYRETFEITPLKLLHKLTLELISYRDYYIKFLMTMLKSNHLEIDIDEIIKYLPVFPQQKLYNLKINDKEQFLSTLHKKSSAFHSSSDDLKAKFTATMKELSPVSDRLSPENYKIGNNRLRHTTGTSLAAQGYDLLEIAQALGNTAGAAKIYVDMSDEVRVSIDDAFDSHTLLSKSFSGSLTSEIMTGEVAVEDMLYGDLGKSINSSSCEKCTLARPIGCYGCEFFRPLISADHESKLVEVEDLYKRRKKSGNSDIALSGIRRTINKIKATISACTLAKISLPLVEG